MNLTKIRKRVDETLLDYRTAVKVCEAEQKSLIQTEDQLSWIEEAQELAQHVSQIIQQKVHNKIAGVVSRCLQTVFTGKAIYGFRMHFERRRGRTEADLILTKNGHEIKDSLNFESGGVVDVAAFALRLSCLVLAKPKLRRLLVLDEPFKFVSAEYPNSNYIENVRMLLEGLTQDFGVQIIMVTHIGTLKIGKIIEL